MRRLLFFPLLMLAALAACEDPSSVGDVFVDDTAPIRVTLPLNSSDTLAVQDFTGQATPVLVGEVFDPLFDVTLGAMGYIDFNGGTPIGTPNRVELRLRPSYVYGDSTAALTMVVRDMPEEWDSERSRADTTFATGAIVTRTAFTPRDSLVVIEMPQAWVEANDTTLVKQSIAFSEAFHGFNLQIEGTGAVTGFNNTSELWLFTASDTFQLGVGKLHSTLSRSGDLRQPPNRVAIMDGLGPVAEFELDVPDSLRGSLTNQASFRLNVDLDMMNSAKPTPTFARPILQRLLLVGVRADSTEILLQDLLDGGSSAGLLINGTYVFQDRLFTAQFQSMLLGSDEFVRFKLQLAQSPNTFNSTILFDGSEDTGNGPRLVLTLLPVEG